MKRMKLRVGDLVTVKRMRPVAGRVVATRRPESPHDRNVDVETVDGERVEVQEQEAAVSDAVSAIAMLDKGEQISVKVEGLLTLNGDGIHIRSRMFVGKPGCTRANAGEFTLRKAEWLSFVSALKLGAALSESRVEAEVPHEPRRTEAGDPAHGCETCDGEDACTCPHKQSRARCLTCGGQWPECGA